MQEVTGSSPVSPTNTTPDHGPTLATVADDDFQERVHASFARQGLMNTLGATLGKVERGAVEITLRPGPGISQQHGFVHAGR